MVKTSPKPKPKITAKKAKKPKQAKVARHKPIPAVISRHRQQLRFRRGEIEVDPLALDPDGVTVSRARVMPVYIRLQRRGVLSLVQSAAAEHYAELCEIASGANWGPDRVLGIRVAAWQQSSPTKKQAAASAELRHLQHAIGGYARRLVDLLVLGNLDIKEIALQLGQRSTERTGGELSAALIHLAEAWAAWQLSSRRRKSPRPAASSEPAQP